MSKPTHSLNLLVAITLTLSSGVFASTYSEVWNEVKSNPYSSLPQEKTTLSSMTQNGVNLIFNSAVRTLNDRSDLLPRFQKLVHPTGICFSGTWTIEESSKYSGYYAKGSKGLIIMRASEAMGNTEAGSWRAFGLAGKIYPTDNVSDNMDYQTANFFTVDDLGGTSSNSFLELGKSNEPKTSIHLNTAFIFPLVTKIAKAFSKADSNPGFRPLYQVSELGMKNPSEAVTPLWMRLQSEGNKSSVVTAKDFRNELRLSRFDNGSLNFGIYVSDKGEKHWQRLGQIVLTEEALSDSCDHRLHFSHPKMK